MSGTKKSAGPVAYTAHKKVMDMALERPGLLFEMESVNAAINFRQNCYKYRTMLRNAEKERLMGLPGGLPEIAYDILVIRMKTKNPETGKLESSKMGNILCFDHERPMGKLIDPETGEEIKLDLPETLFSSDDLT